MADEKPLGIMRRRRTKPDRPGSQDTQVGPRPEATAEGDLGRPPTLGELLRAEINPDDIELDPDLEGRLAATEIRVNGVRVVLSRIRTQEHAGLLLAEATREEMDAEAHYRAWRARLGVEIVTKAKKEVPEWRVRQLIESEPNYLTYRAGISRAAANVLALKAVWETWGDE